MINFLIEAAFKLNLLLLNIYQKFGVIENVS